MATMKKRSEDRDKDFSAESEASPTSEQCNMMSSGGALLAYCIKAWRQIRASGTCMIPP